MIIFREGPPTFREKNTNVSAPIVLLQNVMAKKKKKNLFLLTCGRVALKRRPLGVVVVAGEGRQTGVEVLRPLPLVVAGALRD